MDTQISWQSVFFNSSRIDHLSFKVIEGMHTQDIFSWSSSKPFMFQLYMVLAFLLALKHNAWEKRFWKSVKLLSNMIIIINLSAETSVDLKA